MPSRRRSPGQKLYDRLQSVLFERGFDDFKKVTCKPDFAARISAPSAPPARHFRMHLVGYLERIDSEWELEWRCSDSRSLQAFLRLGEHGRLSDRANTIPA